MPLSPYRYSKIKIPSPSCRYSRQSTTPQIPPLFFLQNIPQHRFQLLPTFQHLPACQLLPGCENFNKLTSPSQHTPAGHTTRAGKDSHSIMIVIIIMISIRLIYIFILFFVDTKRERKDGTQRKNTTIIQSV